MKTREKLDLLQSRRRERKATRNSKQQTYLLFAGGSMQQFKSKTLSPSIMVLVSVLSTQGTFADAIADALDSGKAYGNFNLRHESVNQDNAPKDASALTLRSRVGYITGESSGFSATIEVEDSRVVAGVDDYNNTNGKHAGEYSVIADPETTELDQGFLQYKTKQLLIKGGRQVITMDNHRFIGHVGWRQDRQTFDALSAEYTPTKALSMRYAYLDQRNRIFADEKDIDSKDHLIKVSYKMDMGTLTAYAYLLEEDETGEKTHDTFGVRFNGRTKAGDFELLYTAEFSSQEFESATVEYSSDYVFVEAGAAINGITAKIGYEVLGSDNGLYGFSTPLATLHKFNGWSDQFLATPSQGLVDLTVAFSGKLGGGKWVVAYHDFETDKDSATVDDLGDEFNFSYVRKFGEHYSAGIKYAAYDAGDAATGKVDTDKLWLWVGAEF